MQKNHRPVRRVLRRAHECTRLEAEIWTFVYEQLWLWTSPKARSRPAPISARSHPLPPPILLSPEEPKHHGRCSTHGHLRSCQFASPSRRGDDSKSSRSPPSACGGRWWSSRSGDAFSRRRLERHHHASSRSGTLARLGSLQWRRAAVRAFAGSVGPEIRLTGGAVGGVHQATRGSRVLEFSPRGVFS